MENISGGFVVHQDVEVSQNDLFDATVERMVRQHQGNPLCAVSYHVGVVDGTTPILTRDTRCRSRSRRVAY